MTIGSRTSSRMSAIPMSRTSAVPRASAVPPQNRNQSKKTSRMSRLPGALERRSSVEEENPVVASVPVEIVRPTKKKVIETEVEPPFTDIPLSGEMLDLLYSAVVDYSYFQLAEEKLQFQDTLMFQSRFLK